jgi:peptidoglycan hydrolase-like protein with peptidoglycan-binding domain
MAKKKSKKSFVVTKREKILIGVLVAIILAAIGVYGYLSFAGGPCRGLPKANVMGCPTVKKGSKDKATVKVLQKSLNQFCKQSDITADGKFGDKTVSRLKGYQKARKVSADGIAGKKTWNKMEEDYVYGNTPFTTDHWVDCK